VAERGRVVGGDRGQAAIVYEGAGARPSQLIASVLRALSSAMKPVAHRELLR
jgi:hypothetical protein